MERIKVERPQLER